MDNSFQSNIKSILTSISNDDSSTIKHKYNEIYGEEGYDQLLSEINNIENNYMVEGNYNKNDLNNVTSKISKYYETSINEDIKTNNIDLREKESLIESFQSKLNDLVNSYDERVEYNDLQNQRKYK